MFPEACGRTQSIAAVASCSTREACSRASGPGPDRARRRPAWGLSPELNRATCRRLRACGAWPCRHVRRRLPVALTISTCDVCGGAVAALSPMLRPAPLVPEGRVATFRLPGCSTGARKRPAADRPRQPWAGLMIPGSWPASTRTSPEIPPSRRPGIGVRSRWVTAGRRTGLPGMERRSPSSGPWPWHARQTPGAASGTAAQGEVSPGRAGVARWRRRHLAGGSRLQRRCCMPPKRCIGRSSSLRRRTGACERCKAARGDAAREETSRNLARSATRLEIEPGTACRETQGWKVGDEAM
jgi:hypothetical protein